MKMMQKVLLAAAAVMSMSAPALAEAKASVGTLTCDVSAGVGMFIMEKQTMKCVFKPANGGAEDRYTGKINEYGVAVGAIEKGVLVWGVVTATNEIPGPGTLSGEYGGPGADVAFVAGLGANVLVGGSNKSVALQPLSVEGEVGFNIAAGVTTVTLVAAP
ncbi:DUF992 domain-containing protein [Kaistia dalseonensis]|uniref:DUF992 domain-containing protein n=1 Tax=Kaistia dalseonensis TaxID=410840 RepID=A0ABU0H3U4_9HYPH|nr:DUF992 domain-containing protein [Kaistia dalseonensis]MCX5494368.1 DUF992 domain-containing protein [Kaistia dalseonensis]MDQ0436950.1 hypothetical protein [Kaistia dalseonensis]